MAASGLVVGLAAAATAARAQDVAPPRQHALVIGVNRPQVGIRGVDELAFAEKDAADVETALKDRGFRVVPLTGNVARRENIVGALASLARETNPQDTVLIYFSGHGVRAKWAHEGGRFHTYWLTFDATVARMEEEGLRLEHVMDYVDDIPAAKKLVVLDHCHSGTVEWSRSAAGAAGGGAGGATGARGTTSESAVAKDLFLPEVPGEMGTTATQRVSEALLILGAASDPTAYELPGLKQGIFTSALLGALRTTKADTNKNGLLSADELVTFLRAEVETTAKVNGLKQHPIYVPRGSVLGWELVSVPQDPQAEAVTLLQLIGRLAAAGLDDSTENVLNLSVTNWAGARRNNVPPSDRDQRIVQRLQGIQARGTTVDLPSEASKLRGFVQGLPQ
jgi:hypothetical protein